MVGRPPPKPVIEPSAPITRWQGSTIGNGLRPFAAPTARVPLGVADALRQLRIADRRAERDAREFVPDLQLEVGALRRQRQLEPAAPAIEIFAQLRFGGAQHVVLAAVPVGAVGGMAVVAELDVAQAGVVRRQHQRADRAVDAPAQDHGLSFSAGSSGAMSPSFGSAGNRSRRISSG